MIQILRRGSPLQRPAIAFRVGAPVLLFLAFLVFTCEVAIGSLGPLDLAVARGFEAIWWPPAWPLFEAIAVAGGIELTGLAAAGLLLFLLWRRLWRDALALLAFPFGLLLGTLAKHLVNQPQPPITHAGRLSVTTLVQGPVNSYPSGHVVRAIIVYGLIALTVHRLTTRGWVKRMVVPLASLVVAAIAFDRLYLSVHWASDVIGGLILGGVSLWAALVWVAQSNPGQSHANARQEPPQERFSARTKQKQRSPDS
jgi:membrane-associated phospholipid phosphatase